jgi:hypothetical protein
MLEAWTEPLIQPTQQKGDLVHGKQGVCIGQGHDSSQVISEL